MKTTKDILNQQWEQFDTQSFLKNDPLQVVKSMIEKKPNSIGDIEICAILTATIAWGQREQIIKTANLIMDYCNWQPLEFIKYGDFYDIPDEQNIYRTLKGKAFKEMCHKMRLFYNKYDSIQNAIIQKKASVGDLIDLLSNWGESARLGSPSRNSACKRINMLLRWMVRKDDIDLGLWQTDLITPATLYAILDTHVAQQATRMGLISYPKESWKAVLELTDVYRSWDSKDPIKYDFVLMTNNLQR